MHVRSEGSVKQILVVEDDPLNARLFEMILARRGHYEVSVTDDPDEILSLVRSGHVALVVMDVSLDNARYQGRPIDGVELTRLIKTDEKTRGVPVLLATAHAMRGDKESLLQESGAEGYVSKPIVDHQRFLDKVNSLLVAPAGADLAQGPETKDVCSD
jgi:two-component system cell cycle response regulator DivK